MVLPLPAPISRPSAHNEKNAYHTKIPYNPQGQGIIEKTQQTLKAQLKSKKKKEHPHL